MDLGINGKTALVCGASAGLGRGCAEALLAEGVHVTVVARDLENLQQMKREVGRAAKPGWGELAIVSCDITTTAGRTLALQACMAPDILVTNAGGPPPGNFREWDREQWIAALDANMLTPIELMKATVDGMMGRGFGRIVNITSSSVKAPIDILGLSNGARSGLTGFVAGLARTTVASNVTINNLLPGSFDTRRLASNLAVGAKAQGKSVEDLTRARREAIPAKRFGNAAEFGAFCAFLCSVHASYLTGQNILLDGGAYPGTF